MPPNHSNWKTSYKSWTAAQLIYANALRSQPLPLEELCHYSGHFLDSLRVIRNQLRKAGRLTELYAPVPDHPLNQPYSDRPWGRALPDPGERPLSYATTLAQSAALQVIDRAADEHTPLSRERALKILEGFVTSGQAGRDTDRYIKAWQELAGSAHGSGPPPPTTPAQTTERLLRLLLACPETCVAAAYSQYQEACLARNTPNANPTVLFPTNPPDHNPALGTGGEDPLGPEPETPFSRPTLETPVL